MSKADNDLADAQGDLKKLTGNFDRFAKQTVQKEWGFSDVFRSMPIVDAFESPTKIKQIVLADLPIEYGSFKFVTRYDRCTSCHMAVERVGFDHRTLTKLTRSENDAREARRAAVKAAINDIIASVGDGLPKDAREQLAALDRAVDKGDVVTHVEARAPGSPAPTPVTPETISGKATKVEKNKITLQDDGKETIFAVPDDATVVIDGAQDKLENVKPDSLVTIVKGDDANPFQVIGGLLSKLRDPDAYGPEVVAAVSEPGIQADLVRVKEENEDFREAQSLPKKLETARRILQKRKDEGRETRLRAGRPAQPRPHRRADAGRDHAVRIAPAAGPVRRFQQPTPDGEVRLHRLPRRPGQRHRLPAVGPHPVRRPPASQVGRRLSLARHPRLGIPDAVEPLRGVELSEMSS